MPPVPPTKSMSLLPSGYRLFPLPGLRSFGHSIISPHPFPLPPRPFPLFLLLCNNIVNNIHSPLLRHGLYMQVDLVKLFPQHMWLFPSRAYLASGAGSATAWRALFKALGFTDFIQAPLVALRLTPEQKAASHWADADLGPLDATGHHPVQDWSADEFKAVVTSLQQHCKDKDALQMHCGHLAHCIDAWWEDEFAGCVSVQLGSQVTGNSPVASSYVCTCGFC